MTRARKVIRQLRPDQPRSNDQYALSSLMRLQRLPKPHIVIKMIDAPAMLGRQALGQHRPDAIGQHKTSIADLTPRGAQYAAVVIDPDGRGSSVERHPETLGSLCA